MSIHSVIKEQPGRIPSISPQSLPDAQPSSSSPRLTSLSSYFSHLYTKVTTRHGWVGDYDYAWLCAPTLPFSIGSSSSSKPRRRGPPFYGLDSELPLILAMTCGLQHALAMLAGLITPPIIFASALNLDAETSAYMISASLIGCGESLTSATIELVLIVSSGILSLVQMSRIKLFGGYYLGTGLLSVVGTSFATLSTANAVRYSAEHLPSCILIFITRDPDIRRYVCRRYMPFYNRARRNGHARCMSRCIRDGDR